MKRNTWLLLLAIICIIAIFAWLGIKYQAEIKEYFADSPEIAAILEATPTPGPTLTATCPPMDLSAPIEVNETTRMIVILYDPRIETTSELEMINGDEFSEVQDFVLNIIPGLISPGDEISIFQLGYDRYTSARVARHYSYLTIYPQLYIPPSYSTLTPLPATSIPTAGFGEVATKNAARAVGTERAMVESETLANYNCQVQYYNDNIQSTATTWSQMVVSDRDQISTEMAMDFATAVPSKFQTNEMAYGSLYYGLYFASVDFQADCSRFDECYLVIVDDLTFWGQHNPALLKIDLTNIDVIAVMPTCRDINQPDCTELQRYWTTEFEGFGASEITYLNGLRAELNILNEIGR